MRALILPEYLFIENTCVANAKIDAGSCFKPFCILSITFYYINRARCNLF